MRTKAILGVAAGVFALFSVATPVAAQEKTGDVAFGYSVLHDSDAEETLPMGWLVAGGMNLGSNFALVGEAGGNYKSKDVLGSDLDMSVHSFLGGIRVQDRRAKVMPFGQFQAGVAHGSVSFLGESESSNNFALQPGGGVDIALGSSMGARVQADYRMIRADGGTVNEFRFGFGLVFAFNK